MQCLAELTLSRLLYITFDQIFVHTNSNYNIFTIVIVLRRSVSYVDDDDDDDDDVGYLLPCI